MGTKNSIIRLKLLSIGMLCVSLIYTIYFKLIKNKKHINNRYLIESYYRKDLIININPSTVNYYLPVNKIKEGIVLKKDRRSFFLEGDWSKQIKPIKLHRKTKDMFELYESYEGNITYKKTEAYLKHMTELKEKNLNIKNEPRREILDSKEKIEEYYTSNLRLYKEIKKNGYTKQGLLKDGFWNKEIGIAIDENGNIYRFGNGYHRMAIAKYLNIKKVPAIIKLVHKGFYKKFYDQYQDDNASFKAMIEFLKNN